MTDEQQIDFITKEDINGVISKDVREALLESLKSVNKKANKKEEKHKNFSNDFKAKTKTPTTMNINHEQKEEDKTISY